MAAAAFKGTFFIRGFRSGEPRSVYAAWDDVAGNAVTFGASGASDLQISEDSVLYDVSITTGGTDTLRDDLLINDQYTGNQLDHKVNLNTAQDRQFRLAPMHIRGGSRLRLIQRA